MSNQALAPESRYALNELLRLTFPEGQRQHKNMNLQRLPVFSLLLFAVTNASFVSGRNGILEFPDYRSLLEKDVNSQPISAPVWQRTTTSPVASLPTPGKIPFLTDQPVLVPVPTAAITVKPSRGPTKKPTPSPTKARTKNPTQIPTPTEKPTPSPTAIKRTAGPTGKPSLAPVPRPTTTPVSKPSSSPSKKPKASPQPSLDPDHYDMEILIRPDGNDVVATLVTECRSPVPVKATNVTDQLIRFYYEMNVPLNTRLNAVEKSIRDIEVQLHQVLQYDMMKCDYSSQDFQIYSLDSWPLDRPSPTNRCARVMNEVEDCYEVYGAMTARVFSLNYNTTGKTGPVAQDIINDEIVLKRFNKILKGIFAEQGTLHSPAIISIEFGRISNGADNIAPVVTPPSTVILPVHIPVATLRPVHSPPVGKPTTSSSNGAMPTAATPTAKAPVKPTPYPIATLRPIQSPPAGMPVTSSTGATPTVISPAKSPVKPTPFPVATLKPVKGLAPSTSRDSIPSVTSPNAPSADRSENDAPNTSEVAAPVTTPTSLGSPNPADDASPSTAGGNVPTNGAESPSSDLSNRDSAPSVEEDNQFDKPTNTAGTSNGPTDGSSNGSSSNGNGPNDGTIAAGGREVGNTRRFGAMSILWFVLIPLVLVVCISVCCVVCFRKRHQDYKQRARFGGKKSPEKTGRDVQAHMLYEDDNDDEEQLQHFAEEYEQDAYSLRNTVTVDEDDSSRAELAQKTIAAHQRAEKEADRSCLYRNDPTFMRVGNSNVPSVSGDDFVHAVDDLYRPSTQDLDELDIPTVKHLTRVASNDPIEQTLRDRLRDPPADLMEEPSAIMSQYTESLAPPPPPMDDDEPDTGSAIMSQLTESLPPPPPPVDIMHSLRSKEADELDEVIEGFLQRTSEEPKRRLM